MPKIAVVQSPPVWLDRESTLERAVQFVAEAARGGAAVVVFPEAFVPGYPAWIWRLRPGGDMGLTGQLHERLLASAVDLSRDDLAPLRSAAREHGVQVLCGIDELDGSLSRSTLFNTYVTIGTDGAVLNTHRKLMPTNPERMVWGFGDASGLRVVDSPCGRIGALICWENFMPLARYALYAQGLEVLVSPTWDNGEGWLGSMQHIAREGRCWVVGSGTSLQGRDIPRDFPGREQLYPDDDEWVNAGDSVVVAPGGQISAGPQHEQHGILYAEVDPTRVAVARRSFDVAGHYSRPDVFRLTVNTEPQTSLILSESDG
jgi:nitrilase